MISTFGSFFLFAVISESDTLYLVAVIIITDSLQNDVSISSRDSL